MFDFLKFLDFKMLLSLKSHLHLMFENFFFKFEILLLSI